MGTEEKKTKNSDKNLGTKSVETPSYAILGKYVPVHKFSQEKYKSVTSPISNSSEVPKFCIYDGDYLEKNAISQDDLYKRAGGNFLQYIKFLFTNLPIVNFLFLKLKQLKIQESISTLDNINGDVDKLVSYFEGKSVINEKKYQKICEELVKANNIQTKIKKEFLEEI